MSGPWEKYQQEVKPTAGPWTKYETQIGLTGSVAGQKEPVPASGGFGSNFGAAFKANLLRDPETARREIAKSIFPDDPNGAARVGFFEGRPVFVNDRGEVEFVTGSGTNFAASMAANAPEMIGGAVGSVTPFPVVGATAGASGARGIKNAVTGLVFDEPQTTGANLYDMATEGAIEAGTGLAVKGGLAIANRGRTIDLVPRDLDSAVARRASIKDATGVDVDLALASGDRGLLGVRNYLAQSPGPVGKAIQTADETAAAQFDAATKRVIDAVASPRPSGELGQNAVNAADEAIKAARKAASDKVRPLYDKAYTEVPFIDDPELVAFLELPHFKQAMAAGRRIAQLEGRELPVNAKGATGYSLQDFDYMKQGLDQVIERLSLAGKRKEASALRTKKRELVAMLDERSGDAYKAARAAYAAEAKASIEPLENGFVGVLAKIKQPRVASAAARVLGDPNATVADIQLVRMALAKQNPEAWDGLVRQYVVNAWTKAKTTTQAATEVNAPGKLYQKMWGNDELRAKLTAALGQDQARAFVALMDSAEALAQAPVRGSNTAANLEIQKVLEGPSGWWARVLLSPRSSLANAATQQAVDKNALRLWEGLTDPAKANQLRIAVGISDPVKRAAYISGVLGATTGKAAAQDRQGSGTELPQQPPR